jgi:hypothetical protein
MPQEDTRTVWLVEWSPAEAGRKRKRTKPLRRLYDSSYWAERRVEALDKQARSGAKVLKFEGVPENVSDHFLKGRYDADAVAKRREQAKSGRLRGYLLDNDLDFLVWIEKGPRRDAALSTADRIVTRLRPEGTDHPST